MILITFFSLNAHKPFPWQRAGIWMKGVLFALFCVLITKIGKFQQNRWLCVAQLFKLSYREYAVLICNNASKIVLFFRKYVSVVCRCTESSIKKYDQLFPCQSCCCGPVCWCVLCPTKFVDISLTNVDSRKGSY